MTLEMRELRGDDMFSLLAIIGKLDIRDDFVKVFETNVEASEKVVPMDHQAKKPTKKEQEALDKAAKEAEKAVQRRGMEAVANILQKVLLNIKTIKFEINEFLADLTGLTVQEITELGLKEYTGLIVAVFKKPERKDFFSSIASLM